MPSRLFSLISFSLSVSLSDLYPLSIRSLFQIAIYFSFSHNTYSFLQSKSFNKIAELSLHGRMENAIHTYTRAVRGEKCWKHWTTINGNGNWHKQTIRLCVCVCIKYSISFCLSLSLCSHWSRTIYVFDCYLLEHTEIHQITISKWYLCTFMQKLHLLKYQPRTISPHLSELFVSLRVCISRQDKPTKEEKKNYERTTQA